VRRIVHLAVVLATAAVLAAPLLLGPGSGAILRALGGADEHRCACGMKAGECGCPECERLEHARQLEADALRGRSVMRSTCDDNGARLAPAGGLLVATAPTHAVLPAVAFERMEPLTGSQPDRSLERARPPTPPPRHTSA
jgi:hypothetical protein